MLTCSWGFLSIHTEPIHALTTPPALFPANDAKWLQKPAWALSFHRLSVCLGLEKNSSHNTLAKYTQYLDHRIKNVEETRLSLLWHALLHSLTFISIHKQFGAARGVCRFSSYFHGKLPIQVRDDHSTVQQFFLFELDGWPNALAGTHGVSGK